MRGKQAAASAARRAREGAESEIETYQRRVRDLTAELKEERADRATEVEAFRKEIRTLRDIVASGTSPELMAADAQIRSLLAAVHKAQSVMREQEADVRILTRRLVALVESMLGLSNDEVRAFLFGSGAEFDIAQQKKRDTRLIEAVYRARTRHVSIERGVDGYAHLTGAKQGNRLPFDLLPEGDPFYDFNRQIDVERVANQSAIAELHREFIAALDRMEARVLSA